MESNNKGFSLEKLNGRPLRLLIGGSPCTHWSIAQKNNRETKPEGLGWELFENYLIAKEKFKPDFFLYENNKSAAQPIKDQISTELGVDLQYINSALVSAQNRQRFYAHNIPDVNQPEDRGILLVDILESGATWLEKSYALTTRCSGAIISDTLKRHRHTMVAEPVCVAQRGRYNAEGKIVQKYEPRYDGKTNTITTVTKDNMVCEPVRIGDIGSTAQAHRVYSSFGKSVTINAGGAGQGGKTGLYIAPVFSFGSDDKDKAHCIDANYYKGSNPKQTLNKHRRTMVAELTDFNLDDYENVIIHESGNIEIDGKLIYRIKDGYIWCKEERYEIDLPDGYYTIRKLTPIECERLQTLPDNYTKGISNAQRYKCIGNGWTAEVIIHILSHIDIPKDYPIEVLSMYDGIATGRYCLDKLGYTNITYKAYEIDDYAKKIAMKNYHDIIQCGDAYQVREDDWKY